MPKEMLPLEDASRDQSEMAEIAVMPSDSTSVRIAALESRMLDHLLKKGEVYLLKSRLLELPTDSERGQFKSI